MADSGDMDVDMDIDLGPIDVTDMAAITVWRRQHRDLDTPQSINPDTAIPDMTNSPQNQPIISHKIHVRGVDDLTTDDLKVFAAEHHPVDAPIRYEWIDDTSVNMVFETPAAANRALESFSLSLAGLENKRLLNVQSRPVKTLCTRPTSRLHARIAFSTDVKNPRAYEASRFYLMHPEHDPRGRVSKDGTGRGDHQKRRDGDHRKSRRRLQDKYRGYTSTIYDDSTTSQMDERRENRPGSSSAGSYDSGVHSGRSRRRVPQGVPEDDLYRPVDDKMCNSERHRSASPGHRIMKGPNVRQRTPPPARRNRELFPAKMPALISHQSGKEIPPNRNVAATLKKELFPSKTNGHRRSDAFDAADETADLFAASMDFSERALPVSGTATKPTLSDGRLRSTDPQPLYDASDTVVDAGLIIRGVSKQQSMGVAIRGTAGSSHAGTIRELFPMKVGNSSKELFSERLQGRGQRRNRAEDMFG
ncbi:MAG: hypothetical protein Q9220_007645 [cf. Caloplaca sp. 1 TL-2023]